MKNSLRRTGAALMVALVTLMIVGAVSAVIVQRIVAAHRQSRRHEDELQAQWLAESAVGRAVVQLSRQPSFTSETWQPAIGNDGDPEATGVAQIQVEKVDSQPKQRRIVVDAHYPNHEWRRVAVHREYTISLQPAAQPAPVPETAP